MESNFKIDILNIPKYISNLSNTTKLLDVGCGTGGFLCFVDEKVNYQFFGFDSSQTQINYAQKRFSMVRCAITIEEYIKKIGLPDLKFDLITMWDVLEHIRQ